jgi:hypothetical protein
MLPGFLRILKIQNPDRLIVSQIGEEESTKNNRRERGLTGDVVLKIQKSYLVANFQPLAVRISRDAISARRLAVLSRYLAVHIATAHRIQRGSIAEGGMSRPIIRLDASKRERTTRPSVGRNPVRVSVGGSIRRRPSIPHPGAGAGTIAPGSRGGTGFTIVGFSARSIAARSSRITRT